MKFLLFTALFVALCSINSLGQNVTNPLASNGSSKKEPLKKIELKINLVIPEITEKKSYWKNNYEVRYINSDELNKYRINGKLKLNSQNKIGQYSQKRVF